MALPKKYKIIRQDRHIWFLGMVAFLLLVYAAKLLGPPPSSVEAVAWSAMALWLIVFWGFWVDRHRQPLGKAEGNKDRVEQYE